MHCSQGDRPAISGGGVWIGGVWNGHFPQSEKQVSQAEICPKTSEILQKERFSHNISGSDPSHSIPPLDSLLDEGAKLEQILAGLSFFVLRGKLMSWLYGRHLEGLLCQLCVVPCVVADIPSIAGRAAL